MQRKKDKELRRQARRARKLNGEPEGISDSESGSDDSDGGDFMGEMAGDYESDMYEDTEDEAGGFEFGNTCVGI